MHERINHIIEQVLQDDSINIENIEIVTPEEKLQILKEFNNTKTDYPRNMSVIELFENQGLLLNQLYPSIFSFPFFSLIIGNRAGIAETCCFHAIGSNTSTNQCGNHRMGAPLGKRLIVRFAARAIGMAVDG